MVKFNNGSVCVGSTCEDLETRLKWHLTNKNTQVFKNKDKDPKIQLIMKAPFGKKSLEKD